MKETPQYNNFLQEELADEIKNREAANARLGLMEQAIPKLHEDLKKVQEQLVQSRMEVQAPCNSPRFCLPPVAPTQHLAIGERQQPS